jgi:hypothetical protein
MVVQKVLISLPMTFDLKISALEERSYLATLRMDELHGMLIAYEIWTKQNNPPRKEEMFKESKKSKKNKRKLKLEFSYNDDSDEDE